MTYYESWKSARSSSAGAFTLAGWAMYEPVRQLLDNLWARLATIGLTPGIKARRSSSVCSPPSNRRASVLPSFFADDAVWRVGGSSLAGFSGRREIVRIPGGLPSDRRHLLVQDLRRKRGTRH